MIHWCVYIEHPGIYAWINQHKEHAALSESVRADMIDDTNRKQFRENSGANNGLMMIACSCLNPNGHIANNVTVVN